MSLRLETKNTASVHLLPPCDVYCNYLFFGVQFFLFDSISKLLFLHHWMSCSMLFADEIVIVQSSGNNTNITLTVITIFMYTRI